MGIQINGNTDTISAIDGGLTVSGASLGSASASSLNISGIVTASGGFSGNVTGNITGNVSGNITGNISSSGVSTFTDLRVGTAITANSNGVQVGAGKSVRIFGSTSGNIDIVAPSIAGSSVLTLPVGAGTSGQILRVGNGGTTSWSNQGILPRIASSFWSGSISISNANPGGQASLYGLIAGRVYGDITSITYTPYSSTSFLHISGTVGWGAYSSRSTRGAIGIVLVKDNLTGYEFGDYPRYSGSADYFSYPPDNHIHIVVASGGTTSQTWYLKGWSYNEGTGGTNAANARRGQLSIIEVEP